MSIILKLTIQMQFSVAHIYHLLPHYAQAANIDVIKIFQAHYI